MVDPSRLRRPASADSHDKPAQTGDGPPQTGTAGTDRDDLTAAPDASGPTLHSAARTRDAHDAESDGDDADAVARWMAETLAEAPPVPPAVATLIAGVLVRRPPAA
ncbi:hypothetical protein CcI156_20280 [Frankia sp. CcI156]|uniref:hypothetical protein n=1 Tax=Frankia TaxID=1854 RepID=UPI0005563AF4|nr:MULTISPECIES: hypothetical protein [Frankia]OHV50980.1 hypothetical protein CgIS1_19875 [Frankia sp. CgIS1]ONH22816.1 hypothetical protein CcI156_20280 [Frankia sp. CcI156]